MHFVQLYKIVKHICIYSILRTTFCQCLCSVTLLAWLTATCPTQLSMLLSLYHWSCLYIDKSLYHSTLEKYMLFSMPLCLSGLLCRCRLLTKVDDTVGFPPFSIASGYICG